MGPLPYIHIYHRGPSLRFGLKGVPWSGTGRHAQGDGEAVSRRGAELQRKEREGEGILPKRGPSAPGRRQKRGQESR